MQPEWEPHAGCWTAWPERPDRWRAEAGPAREAYTAVASAIASEPVTMAVSDRQFEAALPRRVRVVEVSTAPAPAREILLGGGDVHCITQQVPAA